MAEFEPAVEFLLSNEGGYSNNPHDHGGETKYGISKRSYPNVDIANLTIEQAKDIYEGDFWNGYGELSSQVIANKCLDMAANMGNRNANKVLQQACGDSGFPTMVDGAFGPNTVAAANMCDETTLLDYVRARAKEHYREIVLNDPTQQVFLNGWLKRAAL